MKEQVNAPVASVTEPLPLPFAPTVRVGLLLKAAVTDWFEVNEEITHGLVVPLHVPDHPVKEVPESAAASSVTVDP
ncbi:MAG TPA: hypothetical protein VK763_20715 [Terriglobales bacterium]|nr:hypothetical protein [Terriglobales bacterium]